MIVKYDNLEACADCTQWLANGEDNSQEGDLEKKIRRQWPKVADRRHMVLGSSEERNEFSWSPCDICGSTLGGERHPVSILGEEKKSRKGGRGPACPTCGHPSSHKCKGRCGYWHCDNEACAALIPARR